MGLAPASPSVLIHSSQHLRAYSVKDQNSGRVSGAVTPTSLRWFVPKLRMVHVRPLLLLQAALQSATMNIEPI